MKSGTTGRKVGPLKIMAGLHADGAPLELKVLVSTALAPLYYEWVTAHLPLSFSAKLMLNAAAIWEGCRHAGKQSRGAERRCSLRQPSKCPLKQEAPGLEP